MDDSKLKFDKQELMVSDGSWIVELCYESEYCENKLLDIVQYDKVIELRENDNYSGSLAIRSKNKYTSETNSLLVTGIDGSVYLHTANVTNHSASIKLIDNCIYFSLGFTFGAIDLSNQELKWQIRPDLAEIFEFYNLENDFLLRGEIEIHRITRDGNVKWSYGGRDIWVNVEGEKEVQIIGEKIVLTDFEHNRYIIDFQGNTLEDQPVIKQGSPPSKWWQIWK